MPAPGKLQWFAYPLSDASVETLEADWRDLSAHAIDANVFLTPWFMRAAIALFGPGPVSLITIYNDGLMIGLFAVTSRRGYKRLPVGYLSTASHAHQFLACPLVRRDYADAFALGVFQWLDQTGEPGTFLRLADLHDDAPVLTAIQKQAASDGRRLLVTERSYRAALFKGRQSPTAWDDRDVTAHLSASRRKSIRRRMRRLAEAGNLKIERWQDSESALDWLSVFLTIEHQGWKGSAQTSILSNPIEKSFYEAMIARAAREDGLAMSLIRLDDQPVACTIDLLSNETAFCIKCAFDEAYRHFAPGVALEIETLKTYAQDQTIRIVDSCSRPTNTLLNELWPHKRLTVSVLIERKTFWRRAWFSVIHGAASMVARRRPEKPPKAGA